MKVLHALSTGQTGGTETSVLRLLPALAARGIAGVVSILQFPSPMAERFAAAGIRVHELGAERGWSHAWRRFGAVLEEERPDVVHAYGFRMSVLARLAPRTRPFVFVHGIRGLHLTDDENPEGTSAALARVLERLLAHRVDCYMANSQGAVEYLSAKGLPRDKFALVRNGIDASRRIPSDAPREEVVACVASLRPVKQIDLLVAALALVAGRGIPFTCVLAGVGPLRARLEGEVDARGLGDRVLFAGALDDAEVAALLARTRVLALPSRWEGMPVSVMEAMAACVPVVAFDVPGVRELVQDTVTGRLVPPGDVPALAAAIEELLIDPLRAARLGAAARERIERDFTLDAQVDGHAAAYERLGRASSVRVAAPAVGGGGA